MRPLIPALLLAAGVYACGPPAMACTPEDGLGGSALICSSYVQAEFYQKASVALGHDSKTFAEAPPVVMMKPTNEHYGEFHGAYFAIQERVIYVNPRSTHEDLFVLYGVFLWLNGWATVDFITFEEMLNRFQPIGIGNGE